MFGATTMPDAHILGSGHTRFGKRPESLLDLLDEAAREALAEARDPVIDHVFVGTQNPEEFADSANIASDVVTRLGLAPVAATRVETAPSSGSSAIECAVFAVRSGLVRNALVVAGEMMTHRSTGDVSAILAKMMDPRERQYGLTMPALTALMTRAAMDAWGLSREDLAAAPVKAHAHGARNPLAQFQRAVTVEEVLASPLVADPLRVFDCAPVSDGAAALVISADEGPVRIAGIGHATDVHTFTDRRTPGALTGFRATRVAADRAFATAASASGIARRDVDVMEMHDAFSILEFANLVDLGFATGDEAIRMVLDGTTSLGGDLPTNVSGGIKARGHPVGATGAAMNVEIFRQLTGRCGTRQVDGARVGLAHNIGGFGSNVLVTLQEAVA